MAAQSNDQILQELDALSHTLYHAHTSKRRTTSLALPRGPTGDAANASIADGGRAAARAPSRRMSMSPFRSRPKLDTIDDDDDDHDRMGASTPSKSQSFGAVPTSAQSAAAGGERSKGGGAWRSWRPIRSLSRIGMQRVGCLFSVEVVSAHGLPPSMNGLRLVVAVRKKDSRDGAVRTMPARVHQGEAHFEEMLFVRCNLYCTGGGGGKGNKPLRFEPRPFLVSAVAVDAPGLDLGRGAVDLGLLVKESAEKAQQGERVRQWDMAFPLAGKAKGGELLVKLAFQIMEDGGAGLYSQRPAAGGGAGKTATGSSSSSSSSSLFARKQTKSSFSIASPKVTTRSETSSSTSLAAAMAAPSPDLKGIDDFKLDEPSHVAPNLQGIADFKLEDEPSPEVVEVKQQEPQKEKEPEEEEELKADDLEFPEFEVVDQGVEEQEQQKDETKEEVDAKEQEKVEEKEGDEVVKEVVFDSAKTWRLNELEAITNQINALESMMLGDVSDHETTTKPADEEPQEEDEVAGLLMDADEEEVTREFLQLLEQGGDDMMVNASAKPPRSPHLSSLKSGAKKPGSRADAACYISDLGKGLGPIVQTRDGGYLAAMNPFDIPVAKKELPKLAMHLSKPFLLRDQRLPGGGAEVFQRLCAGGGGSDALLSKLGVLVSMDDVVGKTAEQIALEGMASAIVTARGSSNKQDDLVLASSGAAAQSVSLLRTMAAAMVRGREDRIATGIWNAREAPVPADEVLAVSLQKMEAMAVEALKVQADMADEKAPFEVAPDAEAGGGHVLDNAVPPEEWASACAGADAVTLLVVVQVRDPLRRYEAVGAPSIVIIQAGRAGAGGGDDEPRFKVTNMHLGGLRLKTADGRTVWDGEKQRLTAMHWLVAYGLGKAGGKKSRVVAASGAKAGNEVLWSMSSRVMADMWLRPRRNPDVKITK